MSILDGTIKEAAALLAGRARELNERPRTFSEIKLAGASDYLSSIGNFVRENPSVGHTLLGGAVGAGLSGASTAYANTGREDRDRRSVLRSMLTGGLAGGAVGGGLSLAHKGISQMRQGSEPPVPQQPMTFKGPDGKPMVISPEALKNNPGLADRVRGAAPKTPIDQEVMQGALGAGAGVASHFPITAMGLPIGAGIDAALNSKRLRLGDRIGWGAIAPENATRPDWLAKGMDTAMEGPGKFFGEKAGPLKGELLAKLRSDVGGHGAVGRMARTGSGYQGTVDLGKDQVGVAAVPKVDVQTGKPLTTPEGTPIFREHYPTTKVPDPKRVQITRGDVGKLMRTGVEAEAGVGNAINPMRSIGGVLGRGTDYHQSRSILHPGRLVPRLGLAALLPALDILNNKHNAETAEQKSLAQLLQELKSRGEVQPAR